MSAYALPSLLAFAVNISLVIIVLLDNLKSRTHRLFALLIFCFALWNVADIIVVSSSTAEGAAVGSVIIVAALLFASAFFLVLTFSFPRSVHSRFDRLPIRPLFLIPPLLFSMLTGLGRFQPLELHRFESQEIFCYVINTSGEILDVAMYGVVFAYLAWGLGNLTVQLRNSPVRSERRKITYVVSGIVGFAVLVVLLDVLREREAVHFYTSRVLHILISLSFAYVVLGNRLLVLRKLGKQGLAYALITGMIFAFYLLVIKSIAEVFALQFQVSSLVIEVLLIVALAFIFRPLVLRIQTTVEHLFRRSAFRRRQEFIRFSREVFRLTKLTELATAVTTFAKETLSAVDAELLMQEVDAYRGILDSRSTLSPDQGTRRLEDSHSACEVAGMIEGGAKENRKLLERYKGGYAVPLLANRGMVGVLLIGPKQKGQYAVDDEEFLMVFGNEVAMALERNMLMERVQEEELRRAQMEKLAALGRLTAGIAHEFRNPLNIIATSAQTILRNPDNTSLHKEAGRYIIEESERLNQTVDDFLQFAKPLTPIWQQVVLVEIIERTIANLRQRADAVGVRVKKDVCGSIPAITTSPSHLERVLVNLGMNAVEAMGNGGELVFRTMRKADHIVVAVTDSGPGITTDIQPRIFDPFFTTKPAGTGLGLSIVYMMVQTLKGEISFVSSSAGTTFTIEMPINPTTP